MAVSSPASTICVQLGRLWQEKANQRLHATTAERPCDLFPRENLTPLDPARPYTLARRYDRTVDAEGFVRDDRIPLLGSS